MNSDKDSPTGSNNPQSNKKYPKVQALKIEKCARLHRDLTLYLLDEETLAKSNYDIHLQSLRNFRIIAGKDRDIFAKFPEFVRNQWYTKFKKVRDKYLKSSTNHVQVLSNLQKASKLVPSDELYTPQESLLEGLTSTKKTNQKDTP